MLTAILPTVLSVTFGRCLVFGTPCFVDIVNIFSFQHRKMKLLCAYCHSASFVFALQCSFMSRPLVTWCRVATCICASFALSTRRVRPYWLSEFKQLVFAALRSSHFGNVELLYVLFLQTFCCSTVMSGNKIYYSSHFTRPTGFIVRTDVFLSNLKYEINSVINGEENEAIGKYKDIRGF